LSYAPRKIKSRLVGCDPDRRLPFCLVVLAIRKPPGIGSGRARA